MQVHEASYLSSSAYCVGELRSITALPELRDSEELNAELQRAGLVTYSSYPGDIFELAERTLRTTLKTSRCSPTDVDALVYASSMYWSATNSSWHPVPIAHRVGTLCRKLGLSRAVPTAVNLCQCVNVISAIRMAEGLLSAGTCKTVLLLVADKVPETLSRLVQPRVSIMSDAAASCLITRRLPGALRIDGSAIEVDYEMLDLEPNRDYFEYLKGTAHGVKTVCDRLFGPVEERARYIQLITPNLNRSVLRLFSGHGTFPIERIFSDNIARYAHCDAADVLINLCDYLERVAPQEGDRLGLLSSSPYAWGALRLTHTS